MDYSKQPFVQKKPHYLAKKDGVERPNALRVKIVDKYIKKVLKQDPKWISVVEQIVKFNIDNRILNNLRQELNEQITD